MGAGLELQEFFFQRGEVDAEGGVWRRAGWERGGEEE